MISTGSKDLDQFTGGYSNELATFYGPSGSGKTTICMLAVLELAKYGKKSLFIDTQQSFSVERFKQLAGPNYKTYLERIFIIPVNNFDEQSRKISDLIKVVENFDLIAIDTFNNFYRKEFRENIYVANKLMEKQIRILNEISKRIPVIITNQIYTDIKEKKQDMVGKDILWKWCSRVFELQINPRMIIEKRPNNKKSRFEIKDHGIIFS